MSAEALQSKRWSARAIADRVIASLALLTLAAICALVFMLALGVVSPAQLAGGWQPGADALSPIPALTGWPRLAVLGGSLGLGLLALLTMLSSATRAPRGLRRIGATQHVVDADELGVVVVDTRGVASVIERSVLADRGVVECEAKVRGDGRSPVEIVLHVGVQPGTPIQTAAASARQSAEEAVERLVGLDIRAVHARVRVLEAEELGRRLLA